MLFLTSLNRFVMRKIMINVQLGNSWINAMKTNLTNMEKNLEKTDKAKHQENIDSNMNHLNNLKDKSADEWREYATQCMIEILENKK